MTATGLHMEMELGARCGAQASREVAPHGHRHFPAARTHRARRGHSLPPGLRFKSVCQEKREFSDLAATSGTSASLPATVEWLRNWAPVPSVAEPTGQYETPVGPV